MKIIVCNIGSSSLKFQLLLMPEELRLARGAIDRVGSPESSCHFWINDRDPEEYELSISTHREGVEWALKMLQREDLLGNLAEIDGVGFKCVQAGEKSGTVPLDDEILQAMEDYRDLAPAHNPPYLESIYMFRERLPKTPLVGVFEPGFHRDVPDYAQIYGTPYDWIAEHGVRRYGYHGASHRFVTGEVARLLGSMKHRIVSCHLGGSSSLCAFKDGKSIDTSMGFTPQTGLIQGTRIGDLDPFVLPYIMERKGLSLEEALSECSKQAGLKGLSGTSGDMRDILARVERGEERAILARQKYIYDIKRYLGTYLLLMEGLDAVAFAGGIGEKDSHLRSEVLSSLGFLGFVLDLHANQTNETLISSGESSIAAYVIQTDEEIVVARETYRLLGHPWPQSA